MVYTPPEKEEEEDDVKEKDVKLYMRSITFILLFFFVCGRKRCARECVRLRPRHTALGSLNVIFVSFFLEILNVALP